MMLIDRYYDIQEPNRANQLCSSCLAENLPSYSMDIKDILDEISNNSLPKAFPYARSLMKRINFNLLENDEQIYPDLNLLNEVSRMLNILTLQNEI